MRAPCARSPALKKTVLLGAAASLTGVVLDGAAQARSPLLKHVPGDDGLADHDVVMQQGCAVGRRAPRRRAGRSCAAGRKT